MKVRRLLAKLREWLPAQAADPVQLQLNGNPLEARNRQNAFALSESTSRVPCAKRGSYLEQSND